jgi:hypothetical protein
MVASFGVFEVLQQPPVTDAVTSRKNFCHLGFVHDRKKERIEIMLSLNNSKIISILGITIFLLGCATTIKDWHNTKSIGTIEAYEQFLRAHPNSDQAKIARSQLTKLRPTVAWSQAESENTIAGYTEFLDKYPQSEQANQAKEKLKLFQAEQDWERMKSAGTIEAYNDFIKKHPTSKYVPMAQQKIADQHWEKTYPSKTSAAYSEFINKHPKSKQVSEAKEKLFYYQFIENPKIETLLNYFEQFPNGEHVSEIAKIGHEKNIGIWIKEKNVMVVIEKLTSNDEKQVPTNKIVNWNVVYETVPADTGKTFATCIISVFDFSNPHPKINRNEVSFVSAEGQSFIPDGFRDMSESARVVSMGISGTFVERIPNPEPSFLHKKKIEITAELSKKVMKNISIEVFERRMTAQQGW